MSGISVHPECQPHREHHLLRISAALRRHAHGRCPRRNEKLEKQIQRARSARGYTILPPSGKLRDLIQCLPHILGHARLAGFFICCR